MFLLDSLMISGIRWALQTVATAAEAEMNDDGVLREQLLEAEMRREMGELSDDEFRRMEASLLARIREIRERRDGGAGPLGFTTLTSGDAAAERVQVEASLTGDFHPPSPTADADAPPSASAGPGAPVVPAARPEPDSSPGPGLAKRGAAAQSGKRRSAPQSPSARRAGKRRT